MIDPANAATPLLLYELTVYDPTISNTRTLYFSDREFRTGAADTPASTLYRNRVTNAGTLAIDLIAAWTKGIAVFGIGTVELSNPDSALDALGKYEFDGWGIKLYLGTIDAAGVLTKTLIFSGIMEEPDRSLKAVTLVVRSPTYFLDKPILTATFAGTGGTSPPEGDVTVKGVTKPRAYGYVFNLPLIPVDAANLIYFAVDRHFDLGTTGSGAGYGQVYDSGLPLPNVDGGGLHREFASLAALYAASISAGSYGFAFDGPVGATYVKLGGLPAGQVTAKGLDLNGAVLNANDVLAVLLNEAFVSGGGGLSTISDLYYPIAGTYPTGVTTAFAGRYVKDTTTTFADVAAGIAASLCGWVWYATGSQLLTGTTRVDNWVLGNFPNDDTKGGVVVVIPAASVVSLTRAGNPQTPDQGVPPVQVSLSTCHNETVQTSGLAATVPVVDRTRLGLEYVTRTKSDGTVTTRFPLASSLDITTIGATQVLSTTVSPGADPQDTVNGFFTALQLNPHFYTLVVALTSELLQYVATAYPSSKHYQWLPALMPSFHGCMLGVQSDRYGFTPTGNGTRCGVLSVSLDLQNKMVTYVVWTTYRPG
jgi:hypothetical protein